MVLVAGPRQVGKTTLARTLPGARAGYLNWDVAEDRERILRRELPATAFWVFDEVHKYRDWRNYLKGLYDARDTRRHGTRFGKTCRSATRPPPPGCRCSNASTPSSGSRRSAHPPSAPSRRNRSLRYFKVRFPNCEAWQVSATGTKDYVNPDGIRVAPALTLLGGLV